MIQFTFKKDRKEHRSSRPRRITLSLGDLRKVCNLSLGNNVLSDCVSNDEEVITCSLNRKDLKILRDNMTFIIERMEDEEVKND